jgi:hypothetical protein
MAYFEQYLAQKKGTIGKLFTHKTIISLWFWAVHKVK